MCVPGDLPLGDAPDQLDDGAVPAPRSREPVEALFQEVLVLCARLGMGSWGIALDGTKIAANAPGAAKTQRGERCGSWPLELAAEHAANDGCEDEALRPGPGDECLPRQPDPRTRAGRNRGGAGGPEAGRQAAGRRRGSRGSIPRGRGRAPARSVRLAVVAERPRPARAAARAARRRRSKPGTGGSRQSRPAGGPRRAGAPAPRPAPGPFRRVRRARGVAGQAEPRAAEARREGRRAKNPAGAEHHRP